MKTSICLRIIGVIASSLLITCLPAQVKIGDNPSVQDPSAVLELEKSNMGLLITRIALTGATDITTIPGAANGLLIFNTVAAGSGGDAVSPGFHYWDSAAGRWKGLLTATGPEGDVWIDGNDNILSKNSADQTLSGSFNVALGDSAFSDKGGPSNYVIAIGYGACNSETTVGDACIVALGLNTAYYNSGKFLNAMGNEAAKYNSGEDVNALGHEAARTNTGSYLNALGFQAGYSNSGYDVNLMGWEAGMNNTQNYLNAFGMLAGQNNQGESMNALGYQAALSNSGNLVNALGYEAALENIGDFVNALGGQAGYSNMGSSVNFLGNQSGQSNTGSEVNAMGAASAQENSNSCVNAFGLEAARYNTGYGTNALGFQSALYNDGDHAVAIGDQALLGDEFISEGGGNIGIGYHAGINVSTGFRNICIGHDTPILNPSADDQINIGNSIIKNENGVIQLNDLVQLPPISVPPFPATAGMIYFDAEDAMLYCYDGAIWQSLW